MKYPKVLLKLMLFAALIYSTPSFTSEQDSDVLPLVLEYIESGQYDRAYEQIKSINFSELEDGVPSIVHNLTGSILIKLNRGKEALQAFTLAEQSGYKNPILDYNRGRAYLLTGELNKAIEHLERYTTTYSESAAALQSLGQAYFENNDYDRAKSVFTQAVTLDSSLDISYFYLAKIAYAQQRYNEAADTLNFLSRNGSDSNLSLEINQIKSKSSTRQKLNTRKPPTTFSGLATISIGRNSNVIALNDGASTPADIDDEADTQSQLGLSLNWRAYDRAGKLVQLGYWLDTQRWNDLDKFDTTTHGLQGIYSHWISNQLLGSAVIGYSTTDLDGIKYLESQQLQLGLRKTLAKNRHIGGLFSYLHQDFTHPSLTAENGRNGNDTTLGFYWTELIYSWNTSSELRYIKSSTSGSNFDSSGYMINFSTSRALPEIEIGEFEYPLHFSANLGYSKSNYDAVNTLSTVKRSDDSIQFSASLSTEFIKNWNADIRFNHLKNDSNVPFYKFGRSNIRFGVTRTF